MILWKGLSRIDSWTHLIQPSRSSSVDVDSLKIYFNRNLIEIKILFVLLLCRWQSENRILIFFSATVLFGNLWSLEEKYPIMVTIIWATDMISFVLGDNHQPPGWTYR